ncbi:hypothetical protein DDZ16_09115 [Marinilabilia rubra]|uniref:Uncharacterized protein n=1 Tax=Marinilabilia rubra TaxID=2162893 RepID=A0A2U2B959_9BACT|nr:hypothetical protein DDZ16_09115 [Marinilabilia rubra]
MQYQEANSLDTTYHAILEDYSFIEVTSIETAFKQNSKTLFAVKKEYSSKTKSLFDDYYFIHYK